MSYEKEEDERSEINWDHEVVRGAEINVPVGDMKCLTHPYFAPPHR